MDMKRNKLIGLLSLCLLAATFASCEDWNETEAVKQKVERPEDQNPELWAEYTAALRDYKQSEHFIVYARLFNSPQPGTSEKDFMRCLPDSLDIVSLTNADNFSKYDAEDMPAMREKGTKVLYQVDYAGRSGELTDETKLGAYLDKVIAAVEKNGLLLVYGYPQCGRRSDRNGGCTYRRTTFRGKDRRTTARFRR